MTRGGVEGDLRCRRPAVKDTDTRAARRFFEENFRPLVVQSPGNFTGYFEPELRGSRAPSRIYTVPVYRRPPDLGDGPYYTRAEIEQGALKGKGLEIAWVQDPVALFEVQVQGSGRIHLAEGGMLSIGFDGSNNRPYTAIGGVLADMGVMRREDGELARDPRLAEAQSAEGPRRDAQERALHLLQGHPQQRRRRLPGRAAHGAAQPGGRYRASRPMARRSGSTPSGR